MRTILAGLMLLALPAQAQDKKPGLKDAMVAEAEAAAAKAPVEEQAAVSKGSVTVAGKAMAYTATAGTLTIRDDAGKPTASMFYTAYVAPGANRPVTFFYNGGPGSATIWLHMGSFAPVRVVTDNPEAPPPAPYAAGPNPWTLIDKTDLVFIDAVGAGWSRPLGDKTGKDFNGVDQDADAFARGIMRYVARNNRWQSPKVLLGESYGTLRSGAVAALLENRGLSLNGVVLLSTIMNYGVRQSGYDQNSQVLLPGFAATAWYHNRLANRPASLEAFLKDVRAFVAGPYASALAKGSAISEAEADSTAQQLAAYTGLSVPFIRRANLRISLAHFQTELLRDQGVTIGRLDTRYKIRAADANADSPEEDPAGAVITGAYFAAFQDHAARTLGYRTDLPYALSARGPGFDWDWRHRPQGIGVQTTPNTAIDLAQTMRLNPHMKVLFLNGYYDMATPFYGAEFDVDHMLLPPELRANIAFKYYESGHMIYLSQAALARLRADMAAWYDAMAR
ncbi:peptidase S10 [Sandarakinorhabdus sp.]|uniref:S10 family peptidase n=1 Tax=Sandarakinorhabdus sp. TaxID=1916663 RepID=UPI00286DBFAE|nr:peptidase S10 [Sandarakinorhabdus sp.]